MPDINSEREWPKLQEWGNYNLFLQIYIVRQKIITDLTIKQAEDKVYLHIIKNNEIFRVGIFLIITETLPSD